jgi:hypothetical protein
VVETHFLSGSSRLVNLSRFMQHRTVRGEAKDDVCAEGIISVSPRKIGWISLALWPISCGYAAFVLCAILSGGLPERTDPVAVRAFWTRTLVVGAVFTAFAVAWTIRRLTMQGYWTLDAVGLTRGRAANQRIPWNEIESLVVGMPSRLPWIFRMTRRLPGRRFQGPVEMIVRRRANAVVLRLRGSRIIAVNLHGANNGDAFMAALVRKCASKVASPETFTPAEVSALTRVTFGKTLSV